MTRTICRCLTALGFFGVAASALGQSADAALARGSRLQQQGDIESAASAFREAVDIEPGRIDAISSLALAYLRLGRPSDAVPWLAKARDAAPGHPGVAYLLGLAHFQAGSFAEAVDELDRAIASQPANIQARHLRALSLLKVGELERGIRALEGVVGSDPSNRQATLTLASAYTKSGQVGQAEAVVRQRLQADESREALLVRGSVLLAKRMHRDALALFERALGGGQALPTLHSQTGVALLYEGRRERAADEFRAELAINPGDFNANAFLGWLVHQDGESDRALELLRAAHRQNETDTGVQYLLAQVHSSRGSWGEAEGLLEQVVEAQPEFIPAHVMLARAYAKLKRAIKFREAQATISALNAKQQERDLQGVDQLYDGRVLSMPRP